MDAKAIKKELTKGKSASLHRRRLIALLSATGAVNHSFISLYQMGVINKLPDLPGSAFDANKVSASKNAYKLGIPDGPLGLGMYATNVILASAMGSHRTGRSPWFDFLLAGAVVASVGGTLDYLYGLFSRQKKASPYCLASAALNFAMLPLAIREAQESYLLMRGDNYNSGYTSRHPATTPAQVHLANIPNKSHGEAKPKSAGA
jgi:uncharacterized membrane protein